MDVIARYDGTEFPVQEPEIGPQGFRDALAQHYPELTGATWRISQVGDVTYWDYAVVAGNKG